MMSRRQFIKKLAAFCSLLPIGVVGFVQWLTGSLTKSAAEKAAESASAAPSHPPEPPKPIPSEPLLSFFLLSDLHISVGEGSMTEKLHWALQDISAFESKVETIVLGGDLTDFGRDSDYALLRRVLDQYALPPIHANMGNHDYYDVWLNERGQFSTETVPNGKTDAQSRVRFQRFFGYDKPYNDVWINGVHLILVSQDVYYQEKPEVGEGAWYSDEQLDWLRRTMTAHADGSPAFIFIHQPLPQPGLDGRTHQLIRANAFRDILKPYRNVFVLSGHQHRNFVGDNSHYNTQNTFHWFSNASVGRTRNRQPGSTKAVSQGLYVQVYADRIVLKGREFSDRTWIGEADWTIPLV